MPKHSTTKTHTVDEYSEEYYYDTVPESYISACDWDEYAGYWIIYPDGTKIFRSYDGLDWS